MQASIIICTRNRAESLRATLETIGKSSVPEGWTIEFLVVDNGSTDHTAEVVRRASFSQTPVKHIMEPRIGKSHAYNTGILTAGGDVLLFTDDDVRVPANWIEGMCRPILHGGADAVAGGVVFPRHIDHQLQMSPLKERRGWLASTHELDPRWPCRMVGANMAFHRRVLTKVPGFDTELGPGPEGLGNFEDTMFSWQLLAAGYKLVGALDVAVEHHFDLRRIAAENLLDSARKMGRSHAFVFYHWRHQRSRLAVPRLMLCHLRHYWRRYFNRGDDVTGGISDQDLRLEYDLAFYSEYAVQRRRQHKYPLRTHAPQMNPAQSCLQGN
jgi:glycosyltransferase involved in cell wall biosynthesis